MKISVMFLGDKINNVTNHRLWPLFKIKGNTTLELEIGRNKTYVFIFLVQFFSGLSSFKKTQLKTVSKEYFPGFSIITFPYSSLPSHTQIPSFNHLLITNSNYTSSNGHHWSYHITSLKLLYTCANTHV